ncbi:MULTISPECIES: histidine--tRNA ligase [unclassified Vibrio]|uniref:histidine--tRNA ligase n=1 Tax=unclassified Vibrio TaxID=2614977 RepID=UPI0014831919|nr:MULTISPECIES: histidine--tRNA ligase [unclassified Vibrio]NNN45568.1 histidine--tRNA ligase [Vibrio sp. 1-1(7)]NNN73397.1 histidine--tRNA ligase [Vibrio sp. 12-2(3-a)]
MNNIQSIRGMKDILPDETPIWQWLENIIRKATHRYGYQEIRLPILEPVALFQRAVGEATDIVSKEMYNFYDKSGEHITLRPEGTSGCVRAVIEQNMCYQTTQRLWYQGPMFRYERPQKGRLRQFTQLGVETFGMPDADIDAELIFMAYDIFKQLGITKHIRLEINSLGTLDERKKHREQLIKYFSDNLDQLDNDSLNRLEKNPLRILDSKNPDMQELLNNAPKLLDHLGEESQRHFKNLCYLLDKSGIEYIINPRLVRGLDYYTRTVFEWITDELGSQGTICGGGRYDGLVELFGNKSIPASGFAIGIERLLLLLETLNLNKNINNSPDIVITYEESSKNIDALLLANEIRKGNQQIKILNDFSGVKLKRQHARALKMGCKLIITLNKEDIRIWNIKTNQTTTTSVETINQDIKHHFL